MQIKYDRWNRVEVWDNYKAGIIDKGTGKVIVPIRFDELYWRIETFRSPAPRIPPLPPKLHGFACFTDDGEAVAYDVDGNIDEWKDWEKWRLKADDDLPSRSLESIENEIRERYMDGATRDDLLELLVERRRLLDSTWIHSPENVAEICRINDMLCKAVQEALDMGREAEKNLKGEWEIELEIYPEWEDDAFQEYIVEMGYNCGLRSASPCFSHSAYYERGGDWDFKSATLDDGVSWDWGFRRPAYQDCYFLHPFQRLAVDNYQLSYSDIISIKKFVINMLITKNADA